MYRPIFVVTSFEMKKLRLIATLTVVSMVCGAGLVSAEGEPGMIAVGEVFVQFTLPAHDGTSVTSTDLDGRPYLLFFYPKASTPG